MQHCLTTVQATWARRWKLRTGSSRAPVLNAAYIAAYLLDPAFAQEKEGRMMLPESHKDYEKRVLEFIDRVGGIEAKEKLELLLLYGWLDAVQSAVRAISKAVLGAKRDADGSIKGKPKMPAMRLRLVFWERWSQGEELLEPLADVAQRLLRAHLTSAATERNWSLWGRVYNSARSDLAQQRAKKMMLIQSDSKSSKLSARSRVPDSNAVVEREVV